MPTPPQELLTPTWNQRHYSPKELAAIFNVSHDSIIRLFRDEPGVLLLTHHDAEVCAGKLPCEYLRVWWSESIAG